MSIICNSQNLDTTYFTTVKIKKGWSLGPLPVIAYNTDIGLKLGGLVDFYDFGSGHDYPKYNHSIYLECSRTTKGGGVNQILYDTRTLIPGIRISSEISLLTEKALNFYGFNGYQAWYNQNYEDPSSKSYISRMFYRMDRKLFKMRSEFYGNLFNDCWKWMGGIEFFGIQLNDVNINKLNEGIPFSEKLPDTTLLFADYKKWGVIKQNEQNGGKVALIKTAIIYDSRDEEANPMKGIWSEFQLLGTTSFLSNNCSYLYVVLTHRQYFTIVPKTLSFVYRVSYQGKLAGYIPFYMLPFIYCTAPNYTRDGLGGNQTIRGVIRNRIEGNDYAYGNIELRWRFAHFHWIHQNFYLALNSFIDGGMVTRPYQLNLTNVPSENYSWFHHQNETLHATYGGGFRVTMNDNFIVSFDVGKPFRIDDGVLGAYLYLGWLF